MKPHSSLGTVSWTPRMTRVWRPYRILEARPRVDGGTLFIVELAQDRILHLGVSARGIEMCALWHDDQCVLWNRESGFCAMLTPQSQQQHSSVEEQMRLLLRRNCFLLGAPIEATPEERRQWSQE